MIFVFTLSHCQSQVKRGFSINDDLLVEHLRTELISAQRIVYDYIKASEKDVYELTIDNVLVLFCNTTHSKYINALNDESI